MLGRLRVPLIPGVVAVVIGIGAMLFGVGASPTTGLMATAFSLFVLYALAGSIMGFMWPDPSWVWGTWVVLPFTLLILLSVAFGGQVGAFIRHDLVPIVFAIGGALLGAAMGSAGRGRLGPRGGPAGL